MKTFFFFFFFFGGGGVRSGGGGGGGGGVGLGGQGGCERSFCENSKKKQVAQRATIAHLRANKSSKYFE